MSKKIRDLSALVAALSLLMAATPGANALALNLDDVASTLSSIKTQLIWLGVAVVVFIIAMVVCVKLKSKATKYMVRSQALVALVVAVAVIVNWICFGPMSTLISLATGDGSISDDTVAEATALVEEISAEGIVLLDNDGTLPLASGSSLNVFGWASTNPCYGGTGSGALSDAYPTVTLLQGLENAGINLNTELSDFYTNYCVTRPTVGMWAQDWTIPEPAASAYTDELMANAKAFSDTAMIVITRVGGEGADLPTDMVSVADGSYAQRGTTYTAGTYDESMNEGDDWDAGDTYLDLTNQEEDMIKLVCDNFDKVVVVYNGANTMELDWVDDYSQIKSVIWCPGTGQSGFSALGKIVTGEVNPSGKTSDTFVRELSETPYFNNIGDFMYDNMDDYAYVAVSWTTGAETTTLPTFVNYVEGIYVGYRYYETAYAEAQAGNSDFDYDAVVQYPFGHGLSYTTFRQEMGGMSIDPEGNISFDVTVTNTGDVAGKDVVEVYYDPPYTNGGIEKAAANLVAFAKTGELAPGASETITISFNEEDMASYDAHGAACYVLEAGDYGISIRTDSHNVIDEQFYTVTSTIKYTDGRSTDASAVTNVFTYAEGDVTYLSRADGFANYDEATATPADYSMSDEHKATFYNNGNYVATDFNDDSDTAPTTGASNGLKLESMRGLAYDDAQWDALLDQLTVADMDTVIALGGYQTQAISSVDKYATIDCDGPASINNNFTGAGSVGFPSAVIIASTWNADMGKAFGQSIGKMADEMGVSGWYAPAMNTHRSAFAGRNFEYYSEDGVLGGVIAANAVQGAEEYGVYAYIKHFALNDQECNRCDMLCTWSTEQAIREVYLKPFEIAVKDGGAKAVMSSFNYIGTQWAGGSSTLCQTILRDEWGFEGFVLTDYFGVYGYMNSDQAIRNGTDCMLVAYDTETNHLKDTTSATSLQAMREACHNIMYTVVNSRAYDPENIGNVAAWKIVAVVIDVVIVLLLAAYELLVVRKKLAKCKAEGTVAVESEKTQK